MKYKRLDHKMSGNLRRNVLGAFLTLLFFVTIIFLTIIPFVTLESKILSVMRSDKILGKRVNDFVLEDQFENKQIIKFSGKHTIIMIGDRQGLVSMRLWEELLKKEFGETVLVLRVAYFKGMPFFVPRSLARNEVKEKHPKASVVLDWDGKVGEQFGYEEGCKISYSDPGGIIRTTAIGECSQERLKVFVSTITPHIRQ